MYTRSFKSTSAKDGTKCDLMKKIQKIPFAKWVVHFNENTLSLNSNAKDTEIAFDSLKKCCQEEKE